MKKAEPSAWTVASPRTVFASQLPLPMAADKAVRSNTSVCLNITAPWFTALPADKQAAAAKKMADLLESEKAAYDVGSYRDAPPGLRIWCGATVETADIVALGPWLDWAFHEARS